MLTNAQEADSSEFYCVAENRAGSVEANFTLHVSLRTAGMSTLGSGQIAGISAALVVLILFILLIILVLFIRLRRMPLKDVKSSAPAEGASGDGSGGTENPSSTSMSRRKQEEIETTSFGVESKPPVSLSLSYVQRPQATALQSQTEYGSIGRFDDQGQQPSVMVAPGACFSSTTSLMPIDNPDLIRDTRRGSAEDITPYGGADYSRMEVVDDAKIDPLLELPLGSEGRVQDVHARQHVPVEGVLGGGGPHGRAVSSGREADTCLAEGSARFASRVRVEACARLDA